MNKEQYDSILKAKYKKLTFASVAATLSVLALISYTIFGESNFLFGTFLISSIVFIIKTYNAMFSYERTFYWGLD